MTFGGGVPQVVPAYNIYNYRRIASEVYVIENGNRNLLPEVLDINWSFQIDRVPTATFRVRNPVPDFIRYFSDVEIKVAFQETLLMQSVFRGKVLNVNPDDRGATVECGGLSWPLDVTFHKTLLTIDNDTSTAVVAAILALAGLTNYDINLPAWTIATLAPITLEFQTYAEALKKVLEVEGAHWYEDPAGGLHIAQIDQISSSTAFTSYFTGTPTEGSFPEIEIPAGAFGEPRIRRIQRSESVREVKNQIYVRGATINTVNATTGETESTDIESTVFAPSIYVLYPNGTQAFNDFLLSNELIETQAKADEVAQRYLFLLNRLQQSTSVDIDGDPLIALARTVSIIDDNYSGVSGLFFVEAYQSSLSASGFSTSLTLFGGGTALNVKPIAAFATTVEREVMVDRVHVVVSFDASASYDPDGEIFSYAWSDNQTPDVATGSERNFTVRVDPAIISQPWIVTLTVTDYGGASATISHTIPIDADDPLVTIPAFSVAFDNRFSATPDGGQTWGDQVGTSVISTAMSPFGVYDPPYILFGTTAGGIYRSRDYCATAPTQVMTNVGSPIVHIWWHTGAGGGVFAITQDGRMYRSTGVPLNFDAINSGGQWTLHENFRVRFSYPALTLNRIDSSAVGLRVFGGTGAGLGRTFIACELSTGTWAEVGTISGDLLTDMNATSPSDLDIITLQYPGTGGASNFGLPWVADFLVVYPDSGTGSAVVRAQGWALGTGSFPFEGGASIATGITSMSTTTVGIGSTINSLGVVYNVFAVRDRRGYIKSGSYTGNGTDKNIEADTVTSPIAAMVFGGTRAVVATSSMAVSGINANFFRESCQIGAAGAFVNDEIVMLLPRGFKVWTGTDANTLDDTYYYVTFAWDRALRVDTYDGTGADNRNVLNGFWQYGIVMGDTAQQKVHRTYRGGGAGDATHVLQAAGAIVTDRIQLLNSPAFQVGTNAQVNGAGSSYHIILFGDAQGTTPISDLYVADGAWRRPLELMIVLNSANAIGGGYTVYYTENFLNTFIAPWKRVSGAMWAFLERRGRYICADYEADRFVVGYDNEFAYRIDVQNGLGFSLRAAGTLDAGDDNNHAIWLGQRISGLSGVYLIAGEGAADGTVYKTVNRFATVQKVRPATGFPAAPASSNAKMVAVGPSAKAEAILVHQSPLNTGADSTYARRVAVFRGGLWELVSNPAAAAQSSVFFMERVGANLYRCLGTQNVGLPAARHAGQLQRSTDNGVTWSNVGPSSVTVGAIGWGVMEVKAGADGVLWACYGINSPSGDAGFPAPAVYKSVDAGANWTLVYEDTTKDGGNWRQFISIATHPTNKNVIAVVGNNGNTGICNTWHTLNGGATAFTRQVGAALQDTSGRRRVTMVDGNRLVGMMAASSARFFYTDDFGASDWHQSLGPQFLQQGWQILRVGQTLFAAGSNGSTTPARIKRSSDGGFTWQEMLNHTPTLGDARIQMVYSAASGKMYVATNSFASTFRVLQWDTPFEVAGALPRELSTLKDITLNLDALFTDADDADQTIALQGITL